MFVNITEKPPWGSVIKAIYLFIYEIYYMVKSVVYTTWHPEDLASQERHPRKHAQKVQGKLSQ